MNQRDPLTIAEGSSVQEVNWNVVLSRYTQLFEESGRTEVPKDTLVFGINLSWVNLQCLDRTDGN